MAVAEGHDLIAFDLLVSVETDVVAALLGGCRRPITVNDGDIKQRILVKLHHRARKWRRCSHRSPTAGKHYRCGCNGSRDDLRHPCRSAVPSTGNPDRGIATDS